MVKITKGKNKGELQERPDKGKLPGDIPEPKFVADPNHRRKQLTGELIRLDLSTVEKKKGMCRMDSIRIGKNFAYFIRTLQEIEEAEFESRGKGVLDHHFDNHTNCGLWCARSKETEDEQKKSRKVYRTQEEDSELYQLLDAIVSKYITLQRLKELAHGLDTNANESFNSLATWFAPKNKVFASSCSLANRLGIAVCIHSIGYEQFYRRLLFKLGIEMTDELTHYLGIVQRNREKRQARKKTTDYKKGRKKRKNEKLVNATEEFKTKFAKSSGVYHPGLNMADVTMEDLRTMPPVRKKAKKAKQYCPFCGKAGHVSKKAKKSCLHAGKSDLEAPPIFCRQTGKKLADIVAESSPQGPTSAAASMPTINQETDDQDAAAQDVLALEEDGAQDLAFLEEMPLDTVVPGTEHLAMLNQDDTSDEEDLDSSEDEGDTSNAI